MSLFRLYVPVEPLTDEHWARLARDLFDRLDQPAARAAPPAHPGARRAILAKLLPALAALAATTLASLLIVRRWHENAGGGRTEIATAEGPSRFSLGQSSLTVAPRSRVRVSGDDDHGVLVVVEQGAVTCEVAPRRGRPAFLVDAGDVEVRVMGTRFTVTRAAAGAGVEVDRGQVEVISRGSSTVLHDGGRWPARL